jgi:thiazole synthase ThiGH ThiG subunit
MSFLNLSGRIGTSAGNIPVLDANGKLDTSILPSLAITDVYVVADIPSRSLLTIQKGDVAIVTGESKTYIYDGMAWQEIKSPTGGVTSVNAQTGTVSLAMANISDVAISGITTGQYLKWNGTVFANTKITFAELTSKPITLAGYGITDAATSASPTLTGIPLAPTAPAGTSTAQIATTAFVANNFAPIDSPDFLGTPTAPTPVAGTATQQLATTAFVAYNFASLDSPLFVGTPTAPTPAIDDVSTQIATTEFVTLAMSNVSSLPSQTGNAGKYLTTNGTISNWGDVSYNTLTNKPTLFSGNYVDLIGKPTLGSAAALNTGIASGNIPVLDASGKLNTSVLPNLGTASSLNTGTSAGNIPVLDASGKLNTSVLPSLAISDVYVVVDTIARNALTVQTGDVAIVTGESKTYIYDGTIWQEVKSPTGTASGVTSVNGQTGVVSMAMANISDVAISGITTGQYLKWNGTVFANTKITFAELTSKPITLAGYGITDAAPSASPTLTGTPIAPTAPAGTSTAQIATTAFVANNFAPIDSPAFLGLPTAPTPVTGTATQQLATTAFVAFNFASLDSPMFSGTPTAPTPTIDDVSTQIATTEFVTLAISNSGGGSSNLPSQTGNTGKYLTTNGTTLSWGDVSYTTLTNKPTLGTAAALNTGIASGNIPVLDASGKLNTSVIPSLAITSVSVVADATARNALTVQTGDVAIVTGESKTYIYDGTTWQEVKSPTGTGGGSVTSVNGQTGVVSLAMTNISDVAISGITTGQYLKWNGTVFANTKITFAELTSKPITLAGYGITDAAPAASPTLTGTPIAPTAPAGTSTAQIATTAFVANSFAPIDSPSFTGVPSAPTPVTGTATQQLATTAFVAFNFASLDSPLFVGTPTAPTPAINDISTQIATTEFVTLAISNSGGGSSLPSQTGNAGKYLTTNGTTASWATVSGGSGSVTDDTSTNTNYYPVFATTTSGTMTAKVSSSKLLFNPSTGTLSSTAFQSLSDQSMKTNIKDISNVLSIIKALHGVKYDWVDGSGSSYGVIAQELEAVIPELIGTHDGVKTVNYNGLIPFLIEAIKILCEKLNV